MIHCSYRLGRRAICWSDQGLDEIEAQMSDDIKGCLTEDGGRGTDGDECQPEVRCQIR